MKLLISLLFDRKSLYKILRTFLDNNLEQSLLKDKETNDRNNKQNNIVLKNEKFETIGFDVWFSGIFLNKMVIYKSRK